MWTTSTKTLINFKDFNLSKFWKQSFSSSSTINRYSRKWFWVELCLDILINCTSKISCLQIRKSISCLKTPKIKIFKNNFLHHLMNCKWFYKCVLGRILLAISWVNALQKSVVLIWEKKEVKKTNLKITYICWNCWGYFQWFFPYNWG